MRAVFVDATDTLAAVMERLRRPDDLPVAIHRDPAVTPDALPTVLDGAEIAIVDHTHLPIAVALRCRGLRHVVFLGTEHEATWTPRRWRTPASRSTSSRAMAIRRWRNAPSR